jgi:beta-glucosidase-like glycosyl hydrolase
MRALREIYLKAFQIAIREGEPWALMTACAILDTTGMTG